ncbi:MAG: hypothetical protein JNK33_06395, partial [Candidatus Doudnabacteria bacterium]|nr:hypothetical protein [Candidatus Doudnabacteria bacterium]
MTVAITLGFAAYNYRTESRERNQRYYKHLPLLNPLLRVELGEKLSQALCGDLPSSYNLAILEREARTYRQAMERNANLDHEVIPPELLERTNALRSPSAIDDGLLQIHQTLIRLGRLNMGYLDAQRQLAMYGPFNYMSDSMARYLAGEINSRKVSVWGVYLLIAATILSVFMNCCRFVERRINPFLIFFLPGLLLVNSGGAGFAPQFVKRCNPVTVRRKALRNAMGFFSALFSFLGISAKTFAQDQQERNETTINHPALVVSSPAKPTWKFNCTVSASSQFHAGLDAAIFYPGPVTALSCTAKRAGLFMGTWMQAPSLSAVPGSTAQEIDWFTGFGSRAGPVKITLTLNYANPSPILKIGRGDALLATLQVDADEEAVGRLKLTPFASVVYATPIRGNKPGKGWIGSTGSNYNIVLHNAWSVGGQVKVIRDFGAFGFPKAYLGYASTGLIRDLGSGVTLTLPNVVASSPFTAGSNRSTYVTV